MLHKLPHEDVQLWSHVHDRCECTLHRSESWYAAEARDEVQELRVRGIAVTEEPARCNPWRALAPRAAPLPMLQAATCKYASSVCQTLLRKSTAVYSTHENL